MRLTLEKGALGFFLSGHLFDAVADEVRRMVPRCIAELGDSREPQLAAGIVGELRIVNGQRGRVGILRLDDKSESIEAVISEDLLDANRELLREDELVIVQGKVQVDRFNGGLRLNVVQLWDLPAARCRFGRYLRVAVNGKPPPVDEVLRDHPARRVATADGERVQGLPVRLFVQRERAQAELDLGDAARFYPSEAAIEAWLRSANVAIVYDTAPA
jgi:DNA polymerase-3 subunit alpha